MLIEHSRKSVGRCISIFVKSGQLFTDTVLLSAGSPFCRLLAPCQQHPLCYRLLFLHLSELSLVCSVECSINCTLAGDIGGLLSLEVMTLRIDRAHQRITQNFAELHNSPLEQVSIITPILPNINFDLLLYLMGCSV